MAIRSVRWGGIESEDCTELYRTVQDCTRLYRTVQDCTRSVQCCTLTVIYSTFTLEHENYYVQNMGLSGQALQEG